MNTISTILIITGIILMGIFGTWFLEEGQYGGKAQNICIIGIIVSFILAIAGINLDKINYNDKRNTPKNNIVENVVEITSTKYEQDNYIIVKTNLDNTYITKYTDDLLVLENVTDNYIIYNTELNDIMKIGLSYESYNKYNTLFAEE